jgi:hypothetical protein
VGIHIGEHAAVWYAEGGAAMLEWHPTDVRLPARCPPVDILQIWVAMEIVRLGAILPTDIDLAALAGVY